MTNANNWTTYWRQGEQSSCLPGADAIRGRLLKLWDEFARHFDEGGTLVDLGSGSGVVAKQMAEANEKLNVVGVDYAKVGDSDHPRVTLKSGVAMDELPFDDGSIDGATSQFAIEYADASKASAELARTLKPGAPFTFVVHHADSPVVAQNAKRRDVLSKLQGKDIEKAYLHVERDALVKQLFELRTYAGEHSQLVDQVARGLGSSINADDGKRAEIWREFRSQSNDELAILAALEDAAVKDVDDWSSKLDAGLEIKTKQAIDGPEGQPIAWLVSGLRG